MRRRDFTILVCLAAMAPRTLFAQPAGKQFRVGLLLFPRRDAPLSVRYVGDFLAGMRELGYTEGQNLEMIYRFADAHADRLQPLAVELAKLKPDVLVGSRGATDDEDLPVRRGQAVGPLDVAQVTAFEGGMHPLGHLGKRLG